MYGEQRSQDDQRAIYLVKVSRQFWENLTRRVGLVLLRRCPYDGGF